MRTRRRVVLLVLLPLAIALSACGAGQPSSAAEDVPATVAPASAPASVEPSAGASAGTSPAGESPGASSSPVAVRKVPPKPGNPTFKRVDRQPGNTKGTFTDTYRITWTSPGGAADSFLVYGMAECPRYAKKHDNTPCVVRGMPIDIDKLTLLGVAPGDKRSIEVSWDIGEVGVPPYSAILMRATNAKGDSIFTIVKSYRVCFECTY